MANHRRNEFIFHDDYCEIVIYSKNYESPFLFKIDLEDYERVYSAGIWHYDGHGYARRTINKKKVSLHRFIMEPKGRNCIDHISRDTTDNRKENLRECSFTNNMRNKACINSSSCITGVTKDGTCGGR